ncbi:MAG: hypothetical protein V7459_01600, partial [Oceanicoccus sp.]
KKTTAKKAPPKKTAVKKTPVKKTTAKKAPPKKTAVKKTPAKKAAPTTVESTKDKTSIKTTPTTGSIKKVDADNDVLEGKQAPQPLPADKPSSIPQKTKKNAIEKKPVHRVEQSLAEDPMEKLEEEVRKENASEETAGSNSTEIKSLFEF